MDVAAKGWMSPPAPPRPVPCLSFPPSLQTGLALLTSA